MTLETEPTIEITAQEIIEEEVNNDSAILELEATINKLKAALEASKQRETVLGQQVTQLQSTIAEHQATAQELNQQLHEAKQAAIHLADANSQLLEENTALKAPPSQESAIQVREKYDPMGYRKSHRIPQQLLERAAEPDDFGANTWLYD